MVINAIPKKNSMLILTIDNDFSVPSIVTVESDEESVIPSKKDDDDFENTSKKSTNKRVRSGTVHFNESKNKYSENTQMYREEINQLWYSRFETREFRKVAGAMGRAIAASAEREQTTSSSSLLLPSSFKNVLQSTLDACRNNCCMLLEEDDTEEEEEDNGKTTTILTAQAQQALHQRLSESTEHLGLERLAVRALGDDRHNRRQNLCKMLLVLQDTLKNQEYFHNNSNNPDAVGSSHHHHAFSKAELIKTRCQAISLSSRHFAREIALAYYYAD